MSTWPVTDIVGLTIVIYTYDVVYFTGVMIKALNFVSI